MNLPGTFLLESPYPTMSRRKGDYNPVYSVSSRVNGKWQLKSHVRERPIKPSCVIGTQDEINEAFIALVEAASFGPVPHCTLVTDNLTSSLKHVCYEMGRWDLVPKKLLVSTKVEEDELQGDSIEVTGIKNMSSLPIPWSCVLEITRYPMGREAAYLFADPKYCGITHPVVGGQCMAIRSVSVIQLQKK